MNTEKLTAYFTYLDNLRESGITNMWGASPYLARAHGLGRDEAGQVVSDWMKTFSHDKAPAERAALVAERDA